MRVRWKGTLITVCVVWTFVSLVCITIHGIFCLFPHREFSAKITRRTSTEIHEKFFTGGQYEGVHSFPSLLNQVRKNLEVLWKDLEGFGDDLNTSSAEHLKGSVHTILKLFRNLEFRIRDFKWMSRNFPDHFKTTTQTTVKDSCPEVYRGPTFGYPFYQRGFETTNCTKTALSDTVTLLFLNIKSNRENTSTRIINIIKNLRSIYGGIHAHFVLQSKNNINSTLINLIENSLELTASYYDQTDSKHLLLERLIHQIHTPYLLILPSLAEFDNNININRLLNIISITNMNIFAVGGSVKDSSTGYWNTGCVQTTLLNYQYTKQEGYYKSMNECMVCDFLMGPFITKVDILKRSPLNENLGEGLFEDWFLRMKSQHFKQMIALSCPDVMFLQDAQPLQDQELGKFSKYWDIRKIIEPDQRTRVYRCETDVVYHTNNCELRQGMLTPPCCLDKLAQAIHFFMEVCKKRDISCEFQEGTMLGAVKFGHVLPWERDADLTFLTADFDKLQNAKLDFIIAGYDFTIEAIPWCCVDGIKAGGIILITVDDWHIEAYGQHIMDSHERKKKGLQPTRVKFAGSWYTAPDNPGQFIRNRYGVEVYRHAEHWQTSKKVSGWEQYKSGEFESCLISGHHACLDQFPADGNLPFQSSFD